MPCGTRCKDMLPVIVFTNARCHVVPDVRICWQYLCLPMLVAVWYQMEGYVANVRVYQCSMLCGTRCKDILPMFLFTNARCRVVPDVRIYCQYLCLPMLVMCGTRCKDILPIFVFTNGRCCVVPDVRIYCQYSCLPMLDVVWYQM